VIAVALAIIACTTAGALVERRSRIDAAIAVQWALRTMLWGLIPFIAFFSLPHLRVTAGVTAGIALAIVSQLSVAGLAWLAGTRWLGLRRPQVGALICSALIFNSGYLGLPMTAALLGKDALPPAIAFDALASGPMFYLVGWAVAEAFGDRGGHVGWLPRLGRLVLRNPPLLGAIAGLLAPASVSPPVLANAAHHAVWGLLILGFFVVGVTLASEAEDGGMPFPPPLSLPVAVAIVLRMGVAPALLALLALIIGGVPHAYLVEEAMPCGINGLVVAHATGLDLRLSSAAIAWSTALAVVLGLGAAAVT
jgi:predicted permease